MVDSEAATEITLARLKQPFCFCSALQKEKGCFNPARVISVAASILKRAMLDQYRSPISDRRVNN